MTKILLNKFDGCCGVREVYPSNAGTELENIDGDFPAHHGIDQCAFYIAEVDGSKKGSLAYIKELKAKGFSKMLQSGKIAYWFRHKDSSKKMYDRDHKVKK